MLAEQLRAAHNEDKDGHANAPSEAPSPEAKQDKGRATSVCLSKRVRRPSLLSPLLQGCCALWHGPQCRGCVQERMRGSLQGSCKHSSTSAVTRTTQKAQQHRSQAILGLT
jgi:hypothetical protein